MRPRGHGAGRTAVSRRWLATCVVAVVVGGCDTVDPRPRPVPSAIQVMNDLATTGIVGSTTGAFVVRVLDASGNAVPDVVVRFSTTLGAGRPLATLDTTDATGSASTSLVLSTVPGPNQLGAQVAGATEARSTAVTGLAGAPTTLTVTPRLLRANPQTTGGTVFATARDQHGNIVSPPLTWTSRNPSLLAVSASQGNIADLQVVSRPGSTWLVASTGVVSDSVPVAILDGSSSPCAYLATPQELAVGGALSFEASGLTCLHSSSAAEYVVTAHYSTAIVGALASLGLVAHGVVPPPPADVAPGAQPGRTAHTFEEELRERELREIPARMAAARAWYDRQASMRALARAPRQGDLTEVNVNAFEFCDEPTPVTARVAAITDGTLILADAANPPGGYSDAEYAAIAALVDTLVFPLDTASFGAPTDIDGNRRIAILFTRAVNELTPRNSSQGIILGFFFSRDLLPRGGAEPCEGSNAGEMFYVLVPDPDAVAGDAVSKAYAQNVVASTIGHELQHLINASRRMYVTRSPRVSEEVWLNEGLSHMAEELLFYRVSGLSPRQNIGPAQIPPGSIARTAHDQFMRGNFGLLSVFLRSTDLTSPLAFSDGLATRGATWSFLRYLADRAGPGDGDLWRRLVNAQSTGVVNLDAALGGAGLTTLSAMRDWSLAMLADDMVPGVAAAYTHPSWNFAAALPYTGYSAGPTRLVLNNGTGAFVSMRAGTTQYFHVAAQAGADTFLQVLSGGGVPAPGMRLTVMRIK